MNPLLAVDIVNTSILVSHLSDNFVVPFININYRIFNYNVVELTIFSISCDYTFWVISL